MPHQSTSSPGRHASAFASDGAVAFDFDGALELARRLVALAHEWELAFATFVEVADAALATWSGPHRDRTAERIAADRQDSAVAVASLRAEASGWARAWAAAAEDLRRERWLAATAMAVDGPAIAVPGPVDVPVPPSFEPTVDLGSGLAVDLAPGWLR